MQEHIRQMAERCINAMGPSIEVMDACEVLGRLSSIFLARVDDEAFSSWIDTVTKGRHHVLEREREQHGLQ